MEAPYHAIHVADEGDEGNEGIEEDEADEEDEAKEEDEANEADEEDEEDEGDDEDEEAIVERRFLHVPQSLFLSVDYWLLQRCQMVAQNNTKWGFLKKWFKKRENAVI